MTMRGGIAAVAQYAQQHGKPLSFPEWGLLPKGGRMRGGGNDPSYIDGIAQTIATHQVAYSSYWYAHGSTALIQKSPASLAALRRHFGPVGDAR
jgi:hypothetical protein